MNAAIGFQLFCAFAAVFAIRWSVKHNHTLTTILATAWLVVALFGLFAAWCAERLGV